MYFQLIYEVANDYLQRRTEFRKEHLQLANDAVARGELLLAGAKGDPIDSACLVFESDSDEVARIFAQADPYVRHGLVRAWRIEPWHVVVGRDFKGSNL